MRQRVLPDTSIYTHTLRFVPGNLYSIRQDFQPHLTNLQEWLETAFPKQLTIIDPWPFFWEELQGVFAECSQRHIFVTIRYSSTIWRDDVLDSPGFWAKMALDSFSIHAVFVDQNFDDGDQYEDLLKLFRLIPVITSVTCDQCEFQGKTMFTDFIERTCVGIIKRLEMDKCTFPMSAKSLYEVMESATFEQGLIIHSTKQMSKKLFSMPQGTVVKELLLMPDSVYIERAINSSSITQTIGKTELKRSYLMRLIGDSPLLHLRCYNAEIISRYLLTKLVTVSPKISLATNTRWCVNEMFKNAYALESLSLEIDPGSAVEAINSICAVHNNCLKSLNLEGVKGFSEEEVTRICNNLTANCKLHEIKWDISLERLPCMQELEAKAAKTPFAETMAHALENDYKIKYNRTKLMFIGAGGAGKTTTVRSLLGESFESLYTSTVVGEKLEVQTFDVFKWKDVSPLRSDNTLDLDVRRLAKMVLDDKDLVKQVKEKRKAADMSYIGQKLADEVADVKAVPLNPATIVNSEDSLVGADPVTRPAPLMASNRGDPIPRRFSLSKDDICLSLWDFGGQQMFESLHHLFFSNKGIYLVVFNTEELVNNPSNELSLLDSWMRSIAYYAPTAPFLMLGTRCENLSRNALDAADDNLSKYLKGFRPLRPVLNRKDQLTFFPLMHSQAVRNREKLRNLKKQISNLVNGRNKKVQVHGLGYEVNASWVAFANHLTKLGKTHFAIGDLSKRAKEVGISQPMLHEMLTFYTEVGTLLYFGKSHDTIGDSISRFVIFNPQWLLTQFAAFIYDVKVHKRKYEVTYDEFPDELEEYEDKGIISKELLEYFWRGLKKEETDFLIKLNLELCLMANYLFRVDNQGDKFVVPIMLHNSSKDELKNLPQANLRMTLLIHFKDYFPIGIYERFLCLLISSSGQIEGTEPPKIYCDYSYIYLQELGVHFIYNQGDRTLELLCHQVYHRSFPTLVEMCKQNIAQLRQDVFGEKLSAVLLVKSEDKLVKLKDLMKAYQKGDEFAQEYSSTNVLSLKKFEKYRPKRREPTRVEGPPSQYDCFLAHEWGEGDVTHDKVVWISELLKGKDLNVWIDENNLTNLVEHDILKGLRASRKAVIFLTKRYMHRSDMADTNCCKELKQAMHMKQVKNVVVVILDEEVIFNKELWATAAGYHLLNLKYINMCNDRLVRENLQQLVDAINRNPA